VSSTSPKRRSVIHSRMGIDASATRRPAGTTSRRCDRIPVWRSVAGRGQLQGKYGARKPGCFRCRLGRPTPRPRRGSSNRMARQLRVISAGQAVERDRHRLEPVTHVVKIELERNHVAAWTRWRRAGSAIASFVIAAASRFPLPGRDVLAEGLTCSILRGAAA
jgi:hypothetical protein